MSGDGENRIESVCTGRHLSAGILRPDVGIGPY